MAPRYRLIRYDGGPHTVSRIIGLSLHGQVRFPSGGSITATEVEPSPAQLKALADAEQHEAVWPANAEVLRRALDTEEQP